MPSGQIEGDVCESCPMGDPVPVVRQPYCVGVKQRLAVPAVPLTQEIVERPLARFEAELRVARHELIPRDERGSPFGQRWCRNLG